jgi:hypothetical protein
MCVAFAGWCVYSQWGSWGAMEYQDQAPTLTGAPKYAALTDHIAQQQAAANP